MPGPITQAAIALLARDRVREIKDALGAKSKNGLKFSDLEKQLKYLAEQTYDIMTSTEEQPNPPSDQRPFVL